MSDMALDTRTASVEARAIIFAHIRPTDVPAFPRETLHGAYSICPICLHGVFPENTSEVAHYLREHNGVTPTDKQIAAAEAEADRFAHEHAADLARTTERRAS